MKQWIAILGVLFFLPYLLALGISPESVSISSYGGQCDQVPLIINNPHETDLVAYLYYTTDLNDTTGLTLNATNPFIAKKGDTQIPLSICTVSNFAPSTFTLNLYSDANIVQDIIYQTTYVNQSTGGGTVYVYKDKNIIVDRNIVIQVPKEIIKERIVEKRIEVPVEKIVYQDKNYIKEVPIGTGLAGLKTENELITVILATTLVAGVAGIAIAYLIFKP